MRTIDDHIEDACRWGDGSFPYGVDPLHMTGWRPTSYVLAQEVLRLRAYMVSAMAKDQE